jgi:hypothetical protein
MHAVRVPAPDPGRCATLDAALAAVLGGLPDPEAILERLTPELLTAYLAELAHRANAARVLLSAARRRHRRRQEEVASA